MAKAPSNEKVGERILTLRKNLRKKKGREKQSKTRRKEHWKGATGGSSVQERKTLRKGQSGKKTSSKIMKKTKTGKQLTGRNGIYGKKKWERDSCEEKEERRKMGKRLFSTSF